MSTYIRKTRDEFEIQGNHGYGWDLETTESTWRAARDQLRVYRSNCPGVQFRCIKRRVRIEAAA